MSLAATRTATVHRHSGTSPGNQQLKRHLRTSNLARMIKKTLAMATVALTAADMTGQQDEAGLAIAQFCSPFLRAAASAALVRSIMRSRSN
jgi:hypothetical protein